MIRAVGIVGILVLAGASQSARGDDTKPFDDADFVMKAASGGMHEVELGKLATTTGKSEYVKKFGQRMVDDHGKANEELKKAASAAGLKVPDKMNAEHQKEYDRIKGFTGVGFDKVYVDHMVKDHEKDLALFTRASKEAKNTQIKEFATKTLPVIKEHLEAIKKIQAGD